MYECLDLSTVKMSVTSNGITYAGASPSGTIAVSSTLPILCTISVALRFNIRRSQKSRLQMDDWTILVALVLVITMGAAAILGELCILPQLNSCSSILRVLGVRHGVWGYPQPSLNDPNRRSSQAFEGIVSVPSRIPRLPWHEP